MRANMRRVALRAGIILLGLLCGSLVLEMGLRIIGLCVTSPAPPAVRSAASPRILCVGDSNVLGVGADRGCSFPEQLQRKLRALGWSGEVINAGWHARNTWEARQVLARDIDRLHPALVITLVGKANEWNYRGFHDFHQGTSWGAGMRRLASDIRVVRLWTVLRARGVPARAEEKRHETPLSVRDPLWVRRQKQGIERAWAWKVRGDLRRAVETLKALDASDPDVHYSLGMMYTHLRRPSDAARSFMRSIELDPDTTDHKSFDGIVAAYRMDADPAVKEAITRFLRAQARDHAQAHLRDALSVISASDRDLNDDIGAWVDADVRGMVEMCAVRGIPIMIVGYPYPAPRVNRILYRVAQSAHVPFVDLETVFTGLLKTTSRRRLFNPDDHCTAAGYGVIADTIFAAMRKEGVYAEALH